MGEVFFKENGKTIAESGNDTVQQNDHRDLAMKKAMQHITIGLTRMTNKSPHIFTILQALFVTFFMVNIICYNKIWIG